MKTPSPFKTPMRPVLTHALLMALLFSAGCQQNPQKPVSEPAPANEAAKAPASEAAKPKDGTPKTCGPTTLDATDAEKWDCLSSIGYFCARPEGCPVQGNLVDRGKALAQTLPLPKGQSYRYKLEAYSEGWICTESAGCLCGSGKVKEGGQCFEDQFPAGDALGGSCNPENCHAHCQGDRCVCGQLPIEENLRKEYDCHVERKRGSSLGRMVMQNQSRELFKPELDFLLQCDSDSGCSCGEASCEKNRICDPKKSRCFYEDGSPAEEEEYCMEESCPCGSGKCPKEFFCKNERCVLKKTSFDIARSPNIARSDDAARSDDDPHFDDETHEVSLHQDELFYCDQPEGCSCGSNVCAQGALCLTTKSALADFTYEYAFQCFRSPQIKSAKDFFGFIKARPQQRITKSTDPRWAGLDYVSSRTYIPDTSAPYFLDVLFDEHYARLEDVKDRVHYWEKKDRIERYVLCEQPGCDCNGTPLQEGYICVRQPVLLGQSSLDKWPTRHFGTCRIPFEPGPRGCELKEEVVEQVCNAPKGCACGSGKIPKGDVCKEGKGQCSSQNPRESCLCGDRILSKDLSREYACRQGQPICQQKDCASDKGTLHTGDLWLKDRILCGEDSTTPGCICGEKPLQKDYRCFEKAQICDCKPAPAGYRPCNCACGDQYLKAGAICGDQKNAEDKVSIKFIEKEQAFLLTRKDQELTRKAPKTSDPYPLNIANWSISLNKWKKGSVDRIDGSDLMTCGTGQPDPGEGYECAYSTADVDAKRASIVLSGYQCIKPEGCSCGESSCKNGDLCEIEEDGSKHCRHWDLTLTRCGQALLPSEYACPIRP